MTRRTFVAALIWVVVVATVVYLHDPPWMGRVTVGLRDWEQAPDGTRYRWTTGRASFFVPSGAASMTVPIRSVFPGPGGGPVTVDISVDDRWLATIALPDPVSWVRPTFPLRFRPTSRRHRRVDLLVSRMVGTSNRGVQIGEVVLERP